MRELLNSVVGGRYYVLKEIGVGGYSRVYKVRDISNGKIFAMKRYITSDPADTKKLVEGMERELNVLKHSCHPVLPKIYNLIKEEDFFLIMEYVEGINLKSYVQTRGVLKKRLLISVMEKVCSGLYYLHSLEPPVVYRDLKPSNIILMENGNIKLIDFGIAKRYNHEIRADSEAVGSRGYAAPEQFGDCFGNGLYNTDIRTDIYGVGTTMYFLKSGKKYEGKIESVKISSKFRRIIKKCTREDPDDRYQNCIEILCDLQKIHRPL